MMVYVIYMYMSWPKWLIVRQRSYEAVDGWFIEDIVDVTYSCCSTDVGRTVKHPFLPLLLLRNCWQDSPLIRSLDCSSSYVQHRNADVLAAHNGTFFWPATIIQVSVRRAYSSIVPRLQAIVCTHNTAAISGHLYRRLIDNDQGVDASSTIIGSRIGSRAKKQQKAEQHTV